MTALYQPTPGTVFGGEFTIVRALSSGGMGAVYIAEQASTGKQRALKLMHPELVADPKLRERFEQEARIGALIASDHVVQVIGAGIDPTTGAPWMAMELLDGEELGDYLRRGALAPAEVYDLFRQICHALASAHAAGIVHRDIKPENLFLARTHSATGTRTVKVLDFGIAKILAEAKTAATAAIGTPLWMAPEQSDPRAPITPASDVWSLGLIAFTALTGHVYWRAASDPHAAMTALMREILFEPTAPASVRAAEFGRSQAIPPGFDEWFARCTDRDPALRYADAAEAFDALGPALSVDGGISTTAIPIAASMTAAATLLAPSASHRPQPVDTGAVTNLAPGYGHPIVMGATVLNTAPRRGKRLALALGLVAATTLAALALIVALQDTPTTESPPRPAPNPPSPSAPAPPVATPPIAAPPVSVSPVAATPKPTPTEPADGATDEPPPKKKPPTSTKPAAKPRPFDHAAAARALQQTSSSAKFHCKGKDGPKAISLTVVFNPAGGVQRMDTDPMVAGKPSVMCAKMLVNGTRVPPFDGDPVSVPTMVGIE